MSIDQHYGYFTIAVLQGVMEKTTVMTTDFSFEGVTPNDLDVMDSHVRDALPYGVIGLDTSNVTVIYNMTEARSTGVSPERVIGSPFFDAFGQCMNNFMVAQRFEDEPELDDIIPYVLTLRMRPTRVRLRMLASAGALRRYVLIER